MMSNIFGKIIIYEKNIVKQKQCFEIRINNDGLFLKMKFSQYVFNNST